MVTKSCAASPMVKEFRETIGFVGYIMNKRYTYDCLSHSYYNCTCSTLLSRFLFIDYRPQGKVMFSGASVSHSVHRWEGVGETTLSRQTPSGQTPPNNDILVAATAAVGTGGMHSCYAY